MGVVRKVIRPVVRPVIDSGQSWSSYWTSLISATAEDANPDEIVLTFPSAQASLTDTDFTVTVNGGAVAVSSASWAGAVLTLVLASNIVCGDTVVVTFVRTGDTTNVTNNVGSAELKLYITGLATPLSSAQRLLLDTFIKSLKTGLSITNLSDAFDVMYILAGETQESSLKNLVKDSNHATLVNAPIFTALEGFVGNGSTSYVNSNFKFATHGVNYKQNDASIMIYSRTNNYGVLNDFGCVDAASVGSTITGRATLVEARCNAGLNSTGGYSAATSLGMMGIDRSASNVTKEVRNGIFVVNATTLSAPLINIDTYICCRNSNGTAQFHTTRQYSFFAIGKSFSEVNHGKIVTAFEAYMDANGKGVIPYGHEQNMDQRLHKRIPQDTQNHIIITEAQASQIRGNYGTIRGTDNTPTARIEPVKTPDGNYIIPEACISAFGLEAVKDTIEQMVTADNVQEIIDLPLMGQPCEKDRLYKYSDGMEDGYNGLVKCVRAHTRTEHKHMDIPALFSFFRENTDDLDWIPNEWVELGWKRMYGGKQYEVIQPHMTVTGQTPDITPALWKKVVEGIGVWIQPTGAHDAYNIGDKVHFPTMADPVYESLIDANVWSPSVLPSSWRLV